MEKAKRYLTRFEETMQLCTKAEKRWYWVAFSLLVLYFASVIYSSFYLFSNGETLTFFIWLLPALFTVAAVSKFLHARSIKLSERQRGRTEGIIFGIVIAFVSFALLFTWQRAFYPGSFSPDSIEQYEQVLSGEYNDWHPVLHTWLFFGLPHIFSQSPALIVTLQLVWFSLALGYLYYVLYTSGCGKVFMTLSYLYIIANPNTALIMLYPWKDSAFTIFAAVLFAQLIRIYKSDGKWLYKWHNLAAFALFAFLTNSMRHNAILLIAPLLLILFVFFKDARKRIAFSAVLLIFATVLLKLPIYSLADVESPDRRQTEMLGLPMTVLQNVYMEDREALSDEATAFMDSLATQENWEKHHQFSNFNSIKWSDTQIPYKVEQEGAAAILKYTAQASLNSPSVAFRSLLSLTSMVWSCDGGGGWTIGYGITRNDLNITPDHKNDAEKNLISYRHTVNSYATKYLFNFVGIIILLLLFSAVAKIGNGGLGKAFAVIPLMIYNFGTMLLLTGHDFRFFHLNFVIVIPLLYIIFDKEKA